MPKRAAAETSFSDKAKEAAARGRSIQATIDRAEAKRQNGRAPREVLDRALVPERARRSPRRVRESRFKRALAVVLERDRAHDRREVFVLDKLKPARALHRVGQLGSEERRKLSARADAVDVERAPAFFSTHVRLRLCHAIVRRHYVSN